VIMGKDKGKDVTPRERLAGEKAIRKLREDEDIKEALRKAAKEQDEKGK